MQSISYCKCSDITITNSTDGWIITIINDQALLKPL